MPPLLAAATFVVQAPKSIPIEAIIFKVSIYYISINRQNLYK